jgi:TP901 family phage tail tape measure protein
MTLAIRLRAFTRELTAPMRAAVEQVKDLGQAGKAMEAKLAEVKGQAAQVEAFKAVKVQTEKVRAEMKAAAERVVQLKREMVAIGPPTREQTRAFEAAVTQARRMKDAHGDAQAKLHGLRSSLVAAGGATRDLGRYERELKARSKELTDQLELQQKRVELLKARTESLANLKQAGKQQMLTGAGVAAVGVGITAAAGRARAGIAGTLEPLVELEDALARLRSLPGITEEQVSQAQKRAREWSLIHADSAAEYANATYEGVSSGLAFAKALEATEAGMATARATAGDATDVVKFMGTVINNTKREAAEAADILTRTQQLFQLSDMTQLRMGMSYAVPVSSSFKVSLEQTAAAIGLLNSAGLTGERAGTSYRGMMSGLVQASKDLGFSAVRASDGGLDLVATLESLAAAMGPLSELTDQQRDDLETAFGTEANAAVLAFLGNMGLLRKGYSEVNSEATRGAAAAAQNVIEAAPSGQLQILENQITDLKIAAGEGLLPAIKELIPSIRDMALGLAEWVREHPALAAFAAKAALVTTAIASILGPIVTVVGMTMVMGGAFKKTRAWLGGFNEGAGLLSKLSLPKLGAGISAIKDGFVGAARGIRTASLAMFASPVAWLAAALLGLAAAIAYVVTKWDDLTGQTNTFTEVAPELANRVRDDTKFREKMIGDAVAGDAAKRAILKQVLTDEPLDELFAAADARARAQKRDALLGTFGLAAPGAVAPGADSDAAAASGLEAQAAAMGEALGQELRAGAAAGATSPAPTVHQANSYQISVQARDGESDDALVQRIKRIIEQLERDRAGSALYDAAVPG